MIQTGESQLHMHDMKREAYLRQGIAGLVLTLHCVAHADDDPMESLSGGGYTLWHPTAKFAGYHLYLCAVWVLFPGWENQLLQVIYSCRWFPWFGKRSLKVSFNELSVLYAGRKTCGFLCYTMHLLTLDRTLL